MSLWPRKNMIRHYPQFFCQLAAAILIWLSTSAFAADPAKEEPVSFHRQVRPILQQKCQGCHQPAKLKGKLLLTSYEGFAQGGSHGLAWVVGKPDDSLVLKHLRGEDDYARMPEGDKPLPAEQIELFARWVRQGARD